MNSLVNLCVTKTVSRLVGANMGNVVCEGDDSVFSLVGSVPQNLDTVWSEAA